MKKIIIFLFIIGLLFSSCGSSKKTVNKTINDKKDTNAKVDKQQQINEYEDRDIDMLKYVARYKKIAQHEMKEYGIPASITIAQGILESQAGKSDLAVKANNHFGVKCHNDWTGKKYLHDDDEVQECFRKYDNAERSFEDHSHFLVNRKRYGFLFRLPKTDYEAWAKGLKKAGYATDPSYPDKLIYLIEKFHLNKLDDEVLEGMSIKVGDNNVVKNTNSQKFIYEVKKGETLFTISSKFHIPVKEIQSINNLNDFDIYEGQILVLTSNNNNESNKSSTDNIQQKTNQTVNDTKVDTKEVVENVIDISIETTKTPQINIPEKERYEVEEGDTFFSIAKKFNLNVNDLLQANNFDKSDKINVGQIIRIPLDKVKKEEPKVVETVTDNTVNDKPVYHIVKPGETLYRIHINYGVSIKKLRKLNHLRGNYIKVGQKLRVK